MTKNEVKTFMLRIKSYYQQFSTENYVLEEWYEKVKDYELKDLHNKLDFHLNGEYSDKIPQLHFLTRNLKTVKQKQNHKSAYIPCRICGKEFELNTQEHEWDKCEERCRRIQYLKAQATKHNFKINTELKMLSIDELDQIYYKVLNFTKDKIKHDEKYYGGEKHSINMVLQTRV